jgi:hypothetical protein
MDELWLHSRFIPHHDFRSRNPRGGSRFVFAPGLEKRALNSGDILRRVGVAKGGRFVLDIHFVDFVELIVVHAKNS